jgi:hypothetical protein
MCCDGFVCSHQITTAWKQIVRENVDLRRMKLAVLRYDMTTNFVIYADTLALLGKWNQGSYIVPDM